jgi:integrase
MLSQTLDFTHPPERSLDHLCTLYCTARTIRDGTLMRYELAVRNLAAAMGRPEKFIPVEAVDLEALVRLRDQTLTTRGNTATTWNTERRHLSALFNFAVKLDWLTLNPIRLVGPAPVPKRPPKALERNAMAAYIEFLDGATKVGRYGRTQDLLPPQWFWLAVLQSLFATGMRKGQLVGLNWGDLDLEKRTVLLRADTSKTGREWLVPISDKLLPTLRRLYEETTAARRRPPLMTEQVFCLPLFSMWRKNFKGGRMVLDNVDSFFQRLRAAVPHHLPRLSAHRVRHTTATLLANTVPNLKVVQELLGHTNISTTMGYVHVDLEDMRRALDSL